MSSAVSQQFMKDAGQSGLTGVIFAGSDVLINNAKLNKRTVTKGVVAAGSDFAGAVGSRWVIPKVTTAESKAAVDLQATYFRPAIAAGAYVLADMLMPFDGRDPVKKALMMAGASVAGSYVYGPIGRALMPKAM